MAGQARRVIALAVVVAASLAAAADTPAGALAGRYSERFRNGLVDGSTYWSENIVEVVPVDATHAYVRFALDFYNGHSCSLSGVAAAQASTLVYVEPADAADDGARCRLTIRRQGGTLAWDDAGTCKSFCGARGSFTSGDIGWASKRPIRYLPRLRASREYRTALTEFRTGRSATP